MATNDSTNPGTRRNDKISSSSGNDTLTGAFGNDTINASGGDDLICAAAMRAMAPMHGSASAPVRRR